MHFTMNLSSIQDSTIDEKEPHIALLKKKPFGTRIDDDEVGSCWANIPVYLYGTLYVKAETKGIQVIY